MRKNPTVAAGEVCAIGIDFGRFEPHDAPAQAKVLRSHLRRFVERAADGSLPLRVPDTAAPEVTRGAGHFHLAPELFLQVSGWTRFAFPHGGLLLKAGEALLLPPRLLHAERVGASGPDERFCNLVVYADGAALTCHLAHEASPGRPGILHLEASRHPQAARIHDWLRDAVTAGLAEGGSASPWAAAQLRALVAAATAGVLRSLDDPDAAEPAEPALVTRVRVLIQNQLGDQALSVRRLAEQSGCTADYLSHLFARSTGERLSAFIVRQRLERAVRLLDESAMAGKEVAWACGFATQSYFIRSFRAHFGLTPKAWRARQATKA